MKNYALITLAVMAITLSGYFWGRRSCCLERKVCLKKCASIFHIAETKYQECLPDIENCRIQTITCQHVAPANRPVCIERAWELCEKSRPCKDAYTQALINAELCRDKCNCIIFQWPF
jgi:hypothetical protein